MKPTTTPITFQEWQATYTALRQRTDRLSAAYVARARQVAAAAGLDPQICFLHAHNAMCSREYGRPWPEVNYSLCRKVLWLERKSWEPSRLLTRISDRLWKRVEWNRGTNGE